MSRSRELIFALLLLPVISFARIDKPYIFYLHLVEKGIAIDTFRTGIFEESYRKYEVNSGDKNQDALLTTFKPELLNDSIEPKYLWVFNYPIKTLNSVSVNPQGGQMLVGIRFKNAGTWIPICDSALIIRYLKMKSPAAISEYVKLYKRFDGENGISFGTAVAVGPLFFTALWGPEVFAFCLPYTAPAFAAGSVIAATSGWYYSKHNEKYAAHETARIFNGKSPGPKLW